MDENFLKKLDRAVQVASRNETRLLGFVGVVTVGAGPERKAGRLTGEAAVVVTVRNKLPRAELEAAGREQLPSRLSGVPVDVLELGAPVEAPEIVAAQQKATAVLEGVREEWLAEPNVTAIGVGYKRTGGERKFNQVALQVFVEQKLPPSEVRRRGFRAVPQRIEGVVTDVVPMLPLRPTSSASGSRDDRKDPLVGGVTVGVNTKPFWFGTLGAIVFDRTSGERLVLSNQHVLDGPAGTDVVQPSPIGLDDSLEVGFQLNVCAPADFFRLDTPNTTVGSVLAAGAAAAALAAALSDEIDPTRRGQDATAPPAGAKTVAESHEVRLGYPELPIPGTRFKVESDWRYTRHTDAGDQSTGAGEVKENPHVLADKLLLTDRTRYQPGDTVRLFGLILPEACAPPGDQPRASAPLKPAELRELRDWAAPTPTVLSDAVERAPDDRGSDYTPAAVLAGRCRCERYHATAILTPTTIDRAYPVVLRPPVARRRGEVMVAAVQAARDSGDEELLRRVLTMVRNGCVYYGEMTAEDVPTGPWRHYLFVQTVNTATGDMEPTEAAQIIGGLPVSQNSTPDVDVACGPVVFEDGQFDIEWFQI